MRIWLLVVWYIVVIRMLVTWTINIQSSTPDIRGDGDDNDKKHSYKKKL